MDEGEYITKRYKVVAEIYRHYIDFQDFYMRTGQHTVEAHGLSICFLDLKDKLHKLSPRKREAFTYHIINDMKQEDVAKLMGIKGVTTGQYCVASCIKLAYELWPEITTPMDKEKKPTSKSPKSDKVINEEEEK